VTRKSVSGCVERTVGNAIQTYRTCRPLSLERNTRTTSPSPPRLSKARVLAGASTRPHSKASSEETSRVSLEGSSVLRRRHSMRIYPWSAVVNIKSHDGTCHETYLEVAFSAEEALARSVQQ
jgi:hypothetical protein